MLTLAAHILKKDLGEGFKMAPDDFLILYFEFHRIFLSVKELFQFQKNGTTEYKR